MMIQIVNSANSVVLDQCNTVATDMQNFITWLNKWGLQANVAILTSQALVQAPSYVYVIQCKTSLVLPSAS